MAAVRNAELYVVARDWAALPEEQLVLIRAIKGFRRSVALTLTASLSGVGDRAVCVRSYVEQLRRF